MPAYMQEFRCKCGECRTNCCHGWRIQLTEAEHRRITSLTPSPALSAAIRQSFALFDPPTPDAYAYIAHGADGRCPMLDGNGLCSLQTECGASVQPAVCRLYPRAVRAGDPTEIVCAGSCEATVEMLMASDAPLSFVTVTGEIAGSMPPTPPVHEEETARRQACIAALQTKSLSLTEKLRAVGTVLGVPVKEETAAEFLTRARTLLLTYGKKDSSIAPFVPGAMDAFSLSGSVTAESAALWDAANARVRARFPRWDAWMENLLVNHLFFVQFPRRDLPLSASVSALLDAYALLTVLTVSRADALGTKEAFADAAAASFRRIEHSNFYETAAKVTG